MEKKEGQAKKRHPDDFEKQNLGKLNDAFQVEVQKGTLMGVQGIGYRRKAH
jgi:hypothetical protein